MRKYLIKELFSIRKGRKEKEIDSIKNGIRYVQIEDLRNENNIKYCEKNSKNVEVDCNDIIIAWDGANAGIVGFDLKGVIGSTLARLRLKDNLNKEKINTQYIGYYLKSQESYIKQNTTGATIPHVSKKVLENIEVYLPSIDIQDKIVEIINKIELTIILRQQQIEALSELKTSIFLDMFGDPQLNPYNWPVGKIGDLTEKTQYGTSKKASENIGAYPILRMNNITYTGELDLLNLKYIDLNEDEKNKYLVYQGELLFNRTNSRELVGKTAVYNKNEPMAFAGYLVKLIPNKNANSFFISGYLNSHYGKRYLYNKAKNSIGMSNINATELKNIPIYIPPIKLQNEYKKKISIIDEKKKLFEKGLKNFEVLYESILQKSFSGELFKEENIEV